MEQIKSYSKDASGTPKAKHGTTNEDEFLSYADFVTKFAKWLAGASYYDWRLGAEQCSCQRRTKGLQMNHPKPPEESFRFKEYDALRSEILNALSDARSLERNVVLAVGAIWAWLAVHVDRAPKQIWWLPFFLAMLGAFRSFAILETFGLMSTYIQKIEERFQADDEIEGWEHFSCERKGLISKTSKALWGALLLTSFIVALYKWWQ